MNPWTEIIQFLGGTAVALAIVGFLARSLIKALFDRDLKTLEIRMKSHADQSLEALKAGWVLDANKELETLKNMLQRERDQFESGLGARRARDERLRSEILRWANPILGAVSDLAARLRNILNDRAYLALQRARPPELSRDWSIDYEYFMPSTMFLFARYFHWVHRLRAEISFELFETQDEKDKFLGEVRKVSQALGDWPLFADASYDDPDCQVFTLQQTGIAEAVTVRAEASRCMGFDEFMDAWEDGSLSDRLAPLRTLLENIDPLTRLRWQRLEEVSAALAGLEEHCRDLLKIPSPDRPVSASADRP